MKKRQLLYLLIVALGFQHCQQKKPAVKKASDDLSWLIGEWESPNSSMVHQEIWNRINDSTLKATVHSHRKWEEKTHKEILICEKGNGVYRITASTNTDTGDMKPRKYMVRLQNPNSFLACGIEGNNAAASYRMISTDSLYVMFGKKNDDNNVNNQYYLVKRK